MLNYESDPKFADEFGAYLVHLREQKGKAENSTFTRESVAAQFDISSKTLERYEKHGGKPSSQNLEKVYKMAIYLGGPDVFVEFEKWRKKHRKAQRAEEISLEEGKPDEVLPSAEHKHSPSGTKTVSSILILISGMLLAILLALIELQFQFVTGPTARESALKELDEIGSGIDSESIQEALRNLDVETIELMETAGVTIPKFEAALYETSVQFMRRSKENSDGVLILEDWLDRGLNPELLVKDIDRNNSSILSTAIMERNIKASELLLENGASAYPYQDLSKRLGSVHLFTSPAEFIVKNKLFFGGELDRIFKALAKSGLKNYLPYRTVDIWTDGRRDPKKPNLSDVTSDSYWDQFTRKPWMNQVNGIPNVPVPMDCSYERSRSICERASLENNINWCDVMDDVPAVINLVSDVNHLTGIMFIYDMINVSGGRGYFKYYSSGTPRAGAHYGIMEVDSKARSFVAHVYGNLRGQMNGKAVMGACEWNENCFLRVGIGMTSAGSGGARVAGEYAEIQHSCRPNEVKRLGNIWTDR